MHIILQVGNKIFSSYGNSDCGIILEYSGIVSKENIIKWLDEEFEIMTSEINIDHTYSDFIVVTMPYNDKVYSGKLISFFTALKHLSHIDSDEIKEYLSNQKAQSYIKLQYGLRDNKLISIQDIPKEQKGLKCNCRCTGCGMRLQARIGNGKRQPHFAHNNEACDIVVAHQSALHILAKEIIQEEKKIGLPALKVNFDEISKNNMKSGYYKLPDEMIYKSAQTVACEQVVLEKKISDIVPDIIVKIGERYCLIEIAVTHFVDETKTEKIKKLGLPVIEIDLSMLSGVELSRDNVKKILLEESDLKYWIHNPKKEEAIIWATNEYEKKDKEIRHIQEEIERTEREKRQRRVEKRKIAKEKIEQLQIGNNYENEIKRLRNDVAFMNLFKHRSFYKDGMAVPFYMDIPITGEVVFDCDKRIWQSAIFDMFIYNRRLDGKPVVNIKKISKWVTSYQQEFKLNWDLVSKAFIALKNSCYERSLLQMCIKEYIEYLSLIGFLSKIYYEVLSAHNLTPPNKEKAAELKAIINSVNQYSWSVTEKIYVMLNPNEYIFSHNSIGKNASNLTNKRINDISNIMKEQKEKSKQLKYNSGLEEIMFNDSLSRKENAVDSFGFRWLTCTSCGEIKREDEMVYLDGNEGLCRDCSRRKI